MKPPTMKPSPPQPNKPMKPHKLLFYTASLIAGASIPFTASAAEETAPVEVSPPPLYRPFTLGVEAGTTGAGVSAAWRFANHWGVRTGFDYLQYSENNLSIGSLHYNTKLQLMSEPLTLDIYPWQKSSFRVSVGMLFNQNELRGTATDAGRLGINGQLSMKVRPELVNPYLGIAGNFFYFDHAHHWAMGGELGAAYTGGAKVSLHGPGAADAVSHGVQHALQRYADQFQWWPVVKLGVSYSF
jgi:hypothetical protein